MLRQDKYKLIVYATAKNSSYYTPQLFDLDKDPWEVNNIAAQHPDLVESMNALLLAQIDYPEVMREFEAQGHDWADRWTQAWANDTWKPLLWAAYENFTQTDEAKFTTWMRS